MSKFSRNLLKRNINLNFYVGNDSQTANLPFPLLLTATRILYTKNAYKLHIFIFVKY